MFKMGHSSKNISKPKKVEFKKKIMLGIVFKPFFLLVKLYKTSTVEGDLSILKVTSQGWIYTLKEWPLLEGTLIWSLMFNCYFTKCE